MSQCMMQGLFLESRIKDFVIPGRSTQPTQYLAQRWVLRGELPTPFPDWRGATENCLISYLSKLNLFWSECCQKNLRPGEDYSIYKLKAVASVCKASVKKKSWFDNPHLSLGSLLKWKTGKALKLKRIGFTVEILKCSYLQSWWELLAWVSVEKANPQLVITGIYSSTCQEPGSSTFPHNSNASN